MSSAAPRLDLAARSRLRVLRGARAMEAALLEDLDALLPPGRLPLAALARPVRVLVPGRSLRLHLASALARARTGGLVGLSIGTLQALALEILDRAGEPPPGSASAFDVLVRRFAREEAPLSLALEPLADGYAAVTGAVRDLVDAGLDPTVLEPLEELLDQLSPERVPPDQRERARSLLRVACEVIAEMERLDIGRAGALYGRAAEVLQREPEAALPVSTLLVYGFTEPPGCAMDLLEALVKVVPSVVYVDHPPDPAHPERLDIGAACTRRLIERLEGRGQAARDEEPPRAAPPPASRPTLFRAAGATEEAREVAHRVRALLDAGVPPERIGVVARDLQAYRVPLRAQLSRLGVPFSGVGALAPPGGMGRRIHAMLELLREREATSMDRWLDALGPRGRVGQRAVQPRRWRPVRLWDLRLGLRALGATDLEDVAALDVEKVLDGRDAVPLPVRHGVWEPAAEAVDEGDASDPDEGEERVMQGGRPLRLSRRRLSGDLLRTAVAAAGDLLGRFRGWPATANLSEHRAHLERLLKEELGWDQDYLGMPPVFGALSALEREFPRSFQLGLDELVLLVARTLYDIGAGPIGGVGAGVAVLNAGEARGRTFEHLFVLGLNRDAFPKIVAEDPLFPDAVRRPLREVLGDLPLRLDAFDRERHLFASLVASSPEVTLSWQFVNDDNRERPPSPLVERLCWERGQEGEDRPRRVRQEIPKVEPLFSRADRAPPPGRALPVEDHVLLAALARDRAIWRALLPVAFADLLGPEGALVEPRALARARAGVLDEVDPDLRSPEGLARRARLGPYYGLIGELRDTGDLRDQPIYVTTVERMGGCPWQVFLERLLRLEPPPDPLQDLPGVDERMVGNTVHLVLQRVVTAALGDALERPLEEVRDREPVPVRWPAHEEVEALLEQAAREVLTEEGFGLAGFVSALVTRARPYLQSAREADWSGGALDVLGAEVEGRVEVRDAAGRPREIRFKADRVDLGASGAIRLTDYKTGRDPLAVKSEGKRKEKLLKRVQEGQNLQAVVYALAGGEGDAQGRYLYLKPDLEPARREAAVSAAEPGFAEAFEDAARTVLSAWDRGSFFPRLVEPLEDREPARCKRCEVAQACLRGDSGARGRLKRWVESAQARASEGAPLPAEEQAALAVWSLGRDPLAGSGDAGGGER